MLKCRLCARKCTAHAWLRKHDGAEAPGEAAIERRHRDSGCARQRWRDRAGGTGAKGICIPVVPLCSQRQGMVYQPQVRSNLYHKLGRLERGGAACHSSSSHL
ncbi:hypothetical protein TRVL_08905 [Trypanosoma vivax]|nr:hypothetical protein TRVL_08905 [Trypanosoma vivax]